MKLFTVAETMDLSELKEYYSINRFYKKHLTDLDMANNSVNIREVDQSVAYPRGMRRRAWCSVQTPLIYCIYCISISHKSTMLINVHGLQFISSVRSL